MDIMLNQVLRVLLSNQTGNQNDFSRIEAGIEGLLLVGCKHVGGVCVDTSGNIYVSDPLQHAIFKISEGGIISLFAGLPGTSGNNRALYNVPIADARFNVPMGLAADNSGK